MVKNQQQYNFLYSYMNMWVEHEKKNEFLDDILFNFGQPSNNGSNEQMFE